MRLANQLDRALPPHLLRAADAVTVASEALADRVREIGGTKAPAPELISNGIDLDFWERTVSNPPRVDGEARVLAVRRLHPVKGFDVLARAMPSVVERVPGVRLHIAGEGRHREISKHSLGHAGWSLR